MSSWSRRVHGSEMIRNRGRMATKDETDACMFSVSGAFHLRCTAEQLADARLNCRCLDFRE